MGQVTRISTTVGTIPAATSIAGGTATSDANSADSLLYTGTDVLTTVLPNTLCGSVGALWVYCASGTPKLARVLAIVPVDLTTPSALQYSIQLDRTMTGLTNTAISYVVADLKSYVVQNTTSTAGVFDGVALAGNKQVSNSIQPPATGNSNWLEAKTFDATSTSFLIQEVK